MKAESTNSACGGDVVGKCSKCGGQTVNDYDNNGEWESNYCLDCGRMVN